MTLLPDWLQLAIALLVLLGAVVTFIGTVGLVRFATFYQRIHARRSAAAWGQRSYLPPPRSTPV